MIEDEPRISSFLKKGLEANGFATAVVSDGEAGLELAEQEEFELIILDLGLPGIDGHQVLQKLGARRPRPRVIILTARNSASETVAGLDGGADDYLTKPFAFEELLARIRVRLRQDDGPTETVLTANGVTLDLRTRRASVGGREIELSTREFILAETLFRHRGQVISREQLLSHVWGYDFDPGSNVVDVYISYLRKKLGPDLIETIRGAGYRLT